MSTTCRICLEDEGDKIAPCRCTGTQQWVHRDCLEHWRAVQRNKLTCEVCGSNYETNPCVVLAAVAVGLWAPLSVLLVFTSVPAPHWLVYPLAALVMLVVWAGLLWMIWLITNAVDVRFQGLLCIPVGVSISLMWFGLAVIVAEVSGLRQPFWPYMIAASILFGPVGVYAWRRCIHASPSPLSTWV